MVAIRLTRTGAKKKPTYRVIVTDKRRPRDSKTLEIVGFYNPRPTPIELNLERERIDYWVGVGAQPSDTVKRLIKFFDAQGPTLSEPKKKAMQAAAEAAPPKARPEPGHADSGRAAAKQRRKSRSRGRAADGGAGRGVTATVRARLLVVERGGAGGRSEGSRSRVGRGDRQSARR
jgi:small subunit ribosomal protein S16